MSITTQSGAVVRLDVLPRVNLLPPEIGERRRFRRVQMGLGGAVVGAIGIVALLYIAASSSVSSAHGELDTAQARTTTLQQQTARYADVTAAYSRAAAAQAMLTQAMGEEVRYSQLLNDLSLSVPENVWVKNLTFTQTPASATGIGTLTVSGVGFSHDDVAVWLESLATQKAYADPYFTNSTEALLGTRKTVNWTSTATLTPNAYSGRYKTAGS